MMVMTRQTIDDQWLGSERHLKKKLNRPWKQATSIRECVSRISLSRPKEARNNKAKKHTSPICHALQCQKNQRHRQCEDALGARCAKKRCLHFSSKRQDNDDRAYEWTQATYEIPQFDVGWVYGLKVG